VLDVGCNSGFFSLEMKRLGASYVLGLEAFPRYFKQAELVRELSGIDIDLRCLNVYDVAENIGQFDITLFLGVLYHLKHPILALENLAKVTSGILIIESAVLPETSQGLPDTSDYGGRKHQLAYIENKEGVEGLQNWFIPSVSCMKAFIATAGFRSTLAEYVSGERAILIARR
jgi:tRNA (mo5U34)-methyltransferase